MIVKNENGTIFEAEYIADDKWTFIEKYLPDYYRNTDVTLFNDICVVLEVIENGHNPHEYITLPEIERDFSNAPFENVGQNVSDISDVKELKALQNDIEQELFSKAIRAYNFKTN